MDTESQTFGLKDGRLLGYGEWGDSDGIPVFLFHGTPGSRILTRAFDAAARDKGFRLIGVDRPGYGLSTFQEGRTILDFPNDVVELADHLGIDNFHTMGGSGGGPYVLACAHAFPERIVSGLVMCGAGPPEGWDEAMRQTMSAATDNPEATQQQLDAFSEMVRTDRAGMIKMVVANVPDRFRAAAEVHPEIAEAYIEHTVEALRQGIEATLCDQQLFLQSWGFDISTISSPIRFWVGEKDALLAAAHYMAEKVPDSTLKIEEEAGHIDGLWITDEILDLIELPKG